MSGRRGPDPGRLVSLQRLAILRKDVALAEFARATDVRAAVLAQIRLIDDAAEAGRSAARSAADAATLAAQDAHARALAMRRAAANLALARQTALWLECRDRAALALGRDDALNRIATDRAKQRTAARARHARPGG